MNREFRTLIVHFFGRFFDRDSRTVDSDAYTGIIQLLALLILPGLALSFSFLMPDHPLANGVVARQWTRVGDRYVFVCYAMVVMGLVMTLKWDSLFPDRRDYLILSSLPISPRRMFAAKVVALVAFMLLFVVAINFFSIVIIPTIYPNPTHSLSWMIDAFEAHAAAVLGASVFSALFFAALQGVLINILTPTAFRRLSPRIQMASITVLVMVFLSLPLFKEGIRPLSEQASGVLGYFPFIWFLGLYETLLPGEWVMPASVLWGRTAIIATGVVAMVCVISYFVGYRRYSRKVLESIDSDALPPSWWQTLTSRILNRTVLRDPFQRATFYFVGKIVNRSPKHRVITALCTGAGIAFALSFAFIFDPHSRAALPFRLSPLGSTEASVMLVFIIVTGLRATFNVPYELDANWMFQITVGRSVDYLRAVRKWVFLCRILPLFAVLALFEFWFFNPFLAIAHLTFDLVLSSILIEVCFLNFNKVPFTCSYPRDKFRMAALAIGYFYGFEIYVAGMGTLKRWAGAAPAHTMLFLAVSLTMLAALALYRHWVRDREAHVIYQEPAASGLLSIRADQGYWNDQENRPQRSARDKQTEIAEEIEIHIRMAVEHRVERGESPEEARFAALREFGNVTLVKETTRSVWTWTSLEQLLQDFKFGSRILWKSPALSATAVILIALVIGGNTSIYSMVHALISKPAPGIEAEHLYYLSPHPRGDFFNSYRDYLDFASQTTTLKPLIAFAPQQFSMGLTAGTFAIWGEAVTPNFFDGLGVHLVKGHPFTEEENNTGGLTAVLSYRVWQEQFQGTANILGQTITLNGHHATVVGVAPPHFQGTNLGSSDEVWVPIVNYCRVQGLESALNDRGSRQPGVGVLGQLLPGVSLRQAQAQVTTISSRLQAVYSDTDKNKRLLIPYSMTGFGFADGAPTFLAIFSVVTIITLIIVCANVANLMLARAVIRQRETAVRQSFGASQVRILRMLIAEGLAISLAAWLAACLFAYWVSRALNWLLPDNVRNPRGVRLPTYFNFTPDWTVLGYAMILAVIGTIAFTIAPAVRSWRQELLPGLRAGRTQRRQRSFSFVRGARRPSARIFSLIAYQRWVAASGDPLAEHGRRFLPKNLLLVTVDPALNAATRIADLSFLERFQDRLRQVPGVKSASYERTVDGGVRQHVSRFAAQEFETAQVNYAGTEYLRVLKMKPILGREFSAEDRTRTSKVAMINQNLAETLWPGQSPIGQTINVGQLHDPFEVIGMSPNPLVPGGVQSDAYFVLLDEEQDVNPSALNGRPGEKGEITFIIEYAGERGAVESAVTQALKETDDRVPLVYSRTLEQQLEFGTFISRVVTLLLTAFSCGSLLIAALGQYAVVAFDMRRRTREFGVRVAMGASHGQILRNVMQEGLILTVAGLGVGFVLSVVAGTALRNFLNGVSPTDLGTYLRVFGLLSAASLLACYIPARRASRIDPLVALRHE